MTERSFPRDIERIAEIYEFSENVMAAGDIDQSVRFPIHLAMEELFVNLVKYNPGASCDIVIEVAVNDGAVTATITDFDAGEFDVTRNPGVDTVAPLEERKPGGLGLHLIQKMVDHLEYDYHHGRSRIRFSKEPGSSDV